MLGPRAKDAVARRLPKELTAQSVTRASAKMRKHKLFSRHIKGAVPSLVGVVLPGKIRGALGSMGGVGWGTGVTGAQHSGCGWQGPATVLSWKQDMLTHAEHPRMVQQLLEQSGSFSRVCMPSVIWHCLDLSSISSHTRLPVGPPERHAPLLPDAARAALSPCGNASPSEGPLFPGHLIHTPA